MTILNKETCKIKVLLLETKEITGSFRLLAGAQANTLAIALASFFRVSAPDERVKLVFAGVDVLLAH